MEQNTVTGFIVGLMIGLLICFVVAISATISSYKKGQIDYHNGKVQYHLQEQVDGSTKWVYNNVEYH